MEGAHVGSAEDPNFSEDPTPILTEDDQVPLSPAEEVKVAPKTALEAGQTIVGVLVDSLEDSNIPADSSSTTTEDLQVPLSLTEEVKEVSRTSLEAGQTMEVVAADYVEDSNIPANSSSTTTEGLRAPLSPTEEVKVVSRTSLEAGQTMEGVPADSVGDSNIPADSSSSTTEDLKDPLSPTEEVKVVSKTALEAGRTMEGVPTYCFEDSNIPADSFSTTTEERPLPVLPTVEVKVVSRTTLETGQAMEGVPAYCVEDSNIPTTEYRPPPVLPTLEGADVCDPTEDLKSLLKAGLVFAIYIPKEEEVEEEEKDSEVDTDVDEEDEEDEEEEEESVEEEEEKEEWVRYASITYAEAGRQYLHYLQDRTLPRGAVTVEMDEVVMNEFPIMVFIDLEWPGSPARRVIFNLIPDTPRGRQFLMMCTARIGPCLVNTRLFEVRFRGLPGEFISGGDYEKNDGTAGAALVPDLEDGDYDVTPKAGCLWGWWDFPELGAQFGITTIDRVVGGSPDTFGNVVEGLEIVQEAAKHEPIQEVTIVDCGVVLFEYMDLVSVPGEWDE